MTLSVPFDQFVSEVKSRLPGEPVYVRWKAGRCSVTAADPGLGLHVHSSSPVSLAEGSKFLAGAGLEVRPGGWDGPEEAEQAAWLGVVAYRSDESKPGLWVHAFDQEPSPIQVVEAMLDEFRRQGIVKEMTLEEFTAKADLNALVFAPQELAAMAGGTVADAI